MRVFISADIEGVANTAIWDHCRKAEYGYVDACKEMTAEVAAACEGAFAAGADYVRIKDAHGSGTNIFPELLPRGPKRNSLELTRSGNGSPFSMVYGIEDGFDAVMFVGYHSAAGKNGNRMSHTYSTPIVYAKLNGEYMSEFMLYSYACAMVGVPTVFLSGDQQLCEDSCKLHPKMFTVPTKRGFGGSTTCRHPLDVHDDIREMTEKALRQDLKDALITIPKHFEFELRFKEQVQAVKTSFFPGFTQIDANTVRMTTDDFMDVMRAVPWVITG